MNKLVKQRFASSGVVACYSIFNSENKEIGVLEKLDKHEGDAWRVKRYGGTSGYLYSTFKEAKDEAINYLK